MSVLVTVTAFTLTALQTKASVPVPKRCGCDPCKISTTSHDTVVLQQPTQCALCHQTFDSRNALFRHVRIHHDPESNNRNSTDNIAKTMKYTLAVWMGYNSQVSPTQAGRMIQDALESYQAINTTNITTITSSTQVSVAKSRPICWNQESHCASAEDILVIKLLQVAIVSATAPFSCTPYLSLTSVTRHIQEYVNQTIAATNTNDTASEPVVRLHGLRILDVTSTSTTSTITSNTNDNNARDGNNSSYYYASYNSKSFHAEQSCTQHEFHALIPIQYLPLSSQAEIRHWVLTSFDQTAEAKRQSSAKMPTVILQLKSILRSMESAEIRPPASPSSPPNNNTSRNNNKNHAHDENDNRCESNNNVRQRPPTSDPTTHIQDITSSTNHETAESMLPTQRQSQNGAKGRFGALAYRVPQYWHNYGNPSLRLSPNNYEPVYRVVDRARIIDFIQSPPFDNKNDGNNNDSDIYLVCCIIGDELLQQQVRRMVATAIAMVHEWLPPNFLDYSINSNHIVETPMFPANLVYRAHSRFHWHEQYNQGRRIFDSNAITRSSSHPQHQHSDDVYIIATEDPAKWMQRTIMTTRTTSTPQPAWMSELQDVVCPRIREQMAMQTRKFDSTLMQKQLVPPPFEYVRVLTLLRSIASNKLWPATSLARSNVINDGPSLSSPVTTTNDTDNNTSHSTGSFTVVNTKIIAENLEMTLPKANKLFPELTEAVFELENFIIQNNFDVARAKLLDDQECNAIETIYPYMDNNQRRSPSTHCAINCNAQFKPHVDSGRGLGQSVSMIVGLGDYYGGEITVEQTRYPIRYRPIEFDGWKLRHWTQPFFGSDRFTLVWFTPATSIITTTNTI